jgi:predicted amidohydrolase YtcJ
LLRPGDPQDRLLELLNRVAAPPPGGRGRLWRHAGVKLFLDGTVEGGTAWLCEPDAAGAGTACAWPDPEAYAAAVHTLDRAGVRTATHAIGDAAVEHAVAVLAATDSPSRHRIEHLETVPLPTLKRLAEVGITASMQPTHCTRCTRSDGTDRWSRLLCRRRVARGWPIGDLRRLGANVTLGSDWPVAHFDPRPIMAEAVLRRPVDDPDDRARQSGQEVTAADALAGYTVHAARAVGEQDTGTIAPGQLADLTVLEADPLELSPASLAGVGVVATVVAGRVVHHR